MPAMQSEAKINKIARSEPCAFQGSLNSPCPVCYFICITLIRTHFLQDIASCFDFTIMAFAL